MIDYMSQKDDAVNILTEKINAIDTQLKEVDLERKQFDKRLDFLLDGDPTEIDQLQLFQKQLSNTQDFDSDKKSF